MKARVLVVDDEPRMAEAVAVALRRHGNACHVCTGALDALDIFDSEGADVVVSDRRMPEMDGLTLMQELKRRSPELPVILITAYADVRSAVAAMRDGAFDYVTKPFDNDELRTLVDRAVELTRLQRENRRLRREIGDRQDREFVAESAAMRSVLELADRAAPSDASVLIQGESGTGKEVIAKRLHYSSPRAGEAFLAVNCKAFAAGILESELFGHEKGAFTGADQRRRGCFERAHGGTLFLDEIGDIDEGFQAKLLRVLQEGEVLPVGADQTRPVNVRVVTATHRDLRREIAEGRFREDLFYRLDVIPLHLPPLRDRSEDILPLARTFLRRHRRNDGTLPELSAAAENLLERHPWPGNVRELENVIERAVVLARGSTLEPADLWLESADKIQTPTAPDGTLQDALDHATTERVRRALETHDGHRAAAAAELGIDRTTLFRLIKRLEI